jgi:UDP-glucose 4-epimerase
LRLAEFTHICKQLSKHIDTIIYTSSSSVYGDNKKAKEKDLINPINLAGSIRYSCEFFISEHLKSKGLKLIIPRIYNMYGGDDEFSVIYKIKYAINQNEILSICNNGSSVRDWIHVSDVVYFYKELLSLNFSGVVNIGTGNGCSLIKIIDLAEELFKKKLQIKNVNRKEVHVSVASIELLTKLVGIRTFITPDFYFKE